MKGKRILVGAAGLVFILLVAAGTYLSLYLDRHKGLLESSISAALGREVRIKKGVSLHWSMTPSIALRGLWVGNPDWAKGEYLARAEQVLLRVRIRGLLKRRLEVKQVTLQNADVALEAAADGRRNWSFGDESDGGMGVLLDALQVENSRLSYRSPAGVDYRTDIAEIRFDGPDETGLALDARFTYRGVPVSASMTSSSPLTTSGSGDRAFKGQVKIPGATLTVSGELAGTPGSTSLDEVKSSRFAIDASGSSLSRLNSLLGLTMPDTPPFTATAQIEGGERRLLVKNLKVTSGKSDIGGRLSIPLAQGERIEGKLESRALHLQTFLEHSDKPAGDDQPFLERELSTGALQDLDGSVRLKVGHLHLDALELEQVGVEADLEKGQLKLTIRAENERMTAGVDLKPVGTEWRVALNHKGKLDLGELIDSAKHGDDESQAPLDLELHLKGAGKSPAAMLQSAEGQFLMVIGEGKLSEKIARHLPLGSVFFTLMGALLPEDQNKRTGKLECAVVQLDIAKGIAISSKGLALRTDQINILGGGALNLRTGEIELRFKAAQRKGIGISILGVADGLVGVTGTLQDPAVSLNVGSAITYGAAAWATAGLSVLADSIFTRVTGFSNPCEAVLQAGRESTREVAANCSVPSH